jgi:hypothetical protein
VSARAGQFPFTVSAASSCAWTATTDATWADATPGSGQGSATPTLRVNENTRNDARTLTLTIGAQSFRIVQEAANCVYTLSETGLDARNEGGRLEFRVTTTADCAWSVSSNSSWLTLLTTSGRGSDAVHISVAPNTGDVRQGFVTVGGQVVTITQARG